MYRNFKKYLNEKVSIGGDKAASKLEFSVMMILKKEELDGNIEFIKCQDSVYLTDARIRYVADFKIKNRLTGEEEWVEAKGFETDVWRIKRRLWEHYGPGPLHIYKGTHKAPKLFETIVPKGYAPKDKG